MDNKVLTSSILLLQWCRICVLAIETLTSHWRWAYMTRDSLTPIPQLISAGHSRVYIKPTLQSQGIRARLPYISSPSSSSGRQMACVMSWEFSCTVVCCDMAFWLLNFDYFWIVRLRFHERLIERVRSVLLLRWVRFFSFSIAPLLSYLVIRRRLYTLLFLSIFLLFKMAGSGPGLALFAEPSLLWNTGIASESTSLNSLTILSPSSFIFCLMVAFCDSGMSKLARLFFLLLIYCCIHNHQLRDRCLCFRNSCWPVVVIHWCLSISLLLLRHVSTKLIQCDVLFINDIFHIFKFDLIFCF